MLLLLLCAKVRIEEGRQRRVGENAFAVKNLIKMAQQRGEIIEAFIPIYGKSGQPDGRSNKFSNFIHIL